MTADQRCQFYESVLAYVYSGSQPGTTDPAVKAAFNMAKGTLDQDLQCYNNTVVKNRQNGSNGGRPRQGITEKNPNEPTQTQKTLSIQLHKQQIKNNVFSLQGGLEREKAVLFELFKRGAALPLEEARKLIDYYDARGWVDKGGNPIVNAGAVARVWKFENGSEYFCRIRKRWAAFLESLEGRWEIVQVTHFGRLEIQKTGENEKTAILYYKNDENGSLFVESLEKNHIKELTTAVRMWGASGLEYRGLLPDVFAMSLAETSAS